MAPYASRDCCEYHIAVDGAELFCRDIGSGRPIVVVHGGPDFDHTYLLPDLDRLTGSYRLIYYDQRGRGRSRGDMRLDRLDIGQYVDDLDALRAHLGFEALALLGHSWGAHVVMHYAIRHPDRVAAMILLNAAPACYDDYLPMRHERERRRAPNAARLERIAGSSAYRDAEPDAESAYYAVEFGTAFARPELADRLRVTWRSKEDVLAGRAIERRLMTTRLFWSEGFTIVPALQPLRAPTLVVHGDRDFVPVAAAERIATAIRGARLVVIPDCGHFAYIEAPARVHAALNEFFASG